MSQCQRLCIILCLLLTPCWVRSQQIPRTEADSLLRLLAQSKRDTNHVNAYIGVGEFHVRKAGNFKVDMDSAAMYARMAYDLSRQLENYVGECRSLNLLGAISRESQDFQQSLDHHQSAIRIYSQHEDLKGEADTHLLLAWTRRDKGDSKDARKDVQKAIELYKLKNDEEGIGEAYIEWGKTFADSGFPLDEKIKYYHKGLQSFVKAGNKLRQAHLHKDLGDLYHLRGNTAQALLELHKSLELYSAVGYRHVQGVYDLIGTLSADVGDYEEGLKYGLLAVQTAEMLKDSTLQICAIYNRLGITYYGLEQYQKAHFFYSKALRIAEKYDHHPSIATVTYNITSALVRLGQPGASVQKLLKFGQKYPPQKNSDSIVFASRLLFAYTQLKNYTLGQQYFDQLIKLSSRLGKNEIIRRIIYYNVIHFLIEIKQYALAKQYCNDFEQFCQNTLYLRGVSQAHLYRFKVDSMQANYPSAIRHYQQHKLLEDSLLNETKSRQIATLEVLHETEKKEKELQLKEQNIKTLMQDRQLQQERSKKDKLIRNGIIVGAVMLLLLLAVVYNRYRLKQRSNSLLQTQQASLQEQQQQIQDKNHALQRLLIEKERLLKEIHHRVKNNLQIVMSLLNSQVASLQDKVALSAIQDSQSRVQAMALIHQKLYLAEGVARIPMDNYVEELAAYLQDTYARSRQVSLKLFIDQIELDVNLAVPLGLIINEAITNSFKYAFPGERLGVVHVTLVQKDETHYQLIIEDDGVGLPDSRDSSQKPSLGMTLIQGFSAQLGGELFIESDHGVKLTLLFADEKLNAMQNNAEYV